MNFHIVSAYNSEISSELSELARKQIWNCPNTPNELGKNFGIVRIFRIDLGKKFGIVRILRMTSNFFNSELSELTSEKIRNSELRSENYHPYSEDIVRFGNYSKLALRKFPH
jgi:hypothetical protein